MATVSGQGTTFNLPNYTGELYQISPSETPFLSAIGGLNGGDSANSTIIEWQTESLESTSVNNSRLEGAEAPTASEQPRSNVSNVVEIHQEAVEVSYTKQAATGNITPISSTQNSPGANPVQNELQHQINLKLRKIGVDIEKSFLSGTYANPSTNATARKTRGILSAITTNVSSASELTKAAVDALLTKMFDNGGLINEGSTVFFLPAALRVTLSNVYAAAGLNQPTQTRNIGGVAIDTLVTDFGTFGVRTDRWMPTGTIGVFDLSVCQPVWLNIAGKGHLFAEPLAKVGASEKYQLYGEVGLKYGPEAYHGKLTIGSDSSSSSSSSSSS